jgi:hypothetical protein
MPVQFVGWRPDLTPQYKQAETARMSLQLREQEMADRKAELERALEQQAFEREMEMLNVKKDWYKALLGEEEAMKRAKLGEEGAMERADLGFERTQLLEEGREKRAEAAQQRMISADEKRMVKDWWSNASNEAQEAILADPEGARVMEEAWGFRPVPGHKTTTPKLTYSELEKIEKDITKRVEEEVPQKGWDLVWPGRSKEQEAEIEKRMSPYREYFEGQYPGVGEARGKGKPKGTEQKADNEIEVEITTGPDKGRRAFIDKNQFDSKIMKKVQ